MAHDLFLFLHFFYCFSFQAAGFNEVDLPKLPKDAWVNAINHGGKKEQQQNGYLSKQQQNQQSQEQDIAKAAIAAALSAHRLLAAPFSKHGAPSNWMVHSGGSGSGGGRGGSGGGNGGGVGDSNGQKSQQQQQKQQWQVAQRSTHLLMEDEAEVRKHQFKPRRPFHSMKESNKATGNTSVYSRMAIDVRSRREDKVEREGLANYELREDSFMLPRMCCNVCGRERKAEDCQRFKCDAKHCSGRGKFVPANIGCGIGSGGGIVGGGQGNSIGGGQPQQQGRQQGLVRVPRKRCPSCFTPQSYDEFSRGMKR
jgi:hypothetical protein